MPDLIDPILVVSAAWKLLFVAIALVLLVMFLFWLDRRMGIRFAKILEIMRSDPKALAIYFGMRMVGCAIIIGLMLG